MSRKEAEFYQKTCCGFKIVDYAPDPDLTELLAPMTGYAWDEDLHAKAVELLAEGKLTIHSSEDGRTINAVPITAEDVLPAKSAS